jgi:beta-mannanase
VRRRRLPLVLVLALSAALAPAVPAEAATGSGSTIVQPGRTLSTPAATTSTGTALVGTYPSYNTSTLDTTNASIASTYAGPDLGAPLTGAGSYLHAMNAWQGKANSIINFYDAPDGNMFSTWVPHIWDTYHAVPMVSMSTSSNTNAEVAAGAADGSIDFMATELKKWVSGATDVYGKSQSTHRRLYIRLNWEPNGWWFNWSPLYGVSGSTTCAQLEKAEQDYIAMWRHVHDRLMSVGLTNTDVAWVFSTYQIDATFAFPNLASCGAAANIIESIYPGDAYVDWVGIDGYAWCTTDTGKATDTPAQTFDPMVSRLRAITSKPLSVNEFGNSTASTIQTTTYLTGNVCSNGQAKAQWLADYFAYVESHNIKMSLTFNSDIYQNTEPIDWAVFAQAGPQDIVGNGDSTYVDPGTGLTYNAYSTYKAGLASPYWLTPDPSNSSVLTDAQFLGL